MRLPMIGQRGVASETPTDRMEASPRPSAGLPRTPWLVFLAMEKLMLKREHATGAERGRLSDEIDMYRRDLRRMLNR